MSHFKNVLYMGSIAKSQGLEKNFSDKSLQILLIYNEMEVRLLIEAAIKYMKKSRRVRLEVQDIELAALSLNHDELTIAPSPKNRSNHSTLISIERLAQNCGFTSILKIQQSKLKAQWLYLNSKICKESSTHRISKLRKGQLDSIKPKNQIGNTNLILFQHTKRLSLEETEQFSRIKKILVENEPHLISSFQGNIPKVFSLYLHLIRQCPNQAGIVALLNLMKHPLVSRNLILFHLHHIFEILMVYRGRMSYKVGIILAKMVQQYKDQQPALLNIMNRDSTDFSFLIKVFAFEEQLNLNLTNMNLEKVFSKSFEQSWTGNEMAMICLNILIKKLPVLITASKQLPRLPFWLIPQWFTDDDYLML